MAPITGLFRLCIIYLCPSTGATDLDYNLNCLQMSVCAVKKTTNRLDTIEHPNILGHNDTFQHL